MARQTTLAWLTDSYGVVDFGDPLDRLALDVDPAIPGTPTPGGNVIAGGSGGTSGTHVRPLPGESVPGSVAQSVIDRLLETHSHTIHELEQRLTVIEDETRLDSVVADGWQLYFLAPEAAVSTAAVDAWVPVGGLYRIVSSDVLATIVWRVQLRVSSADFALAANAYFAARMLVNGGELGARATWRHVDHDLQLPGSADTMTTTIMLQGAIPIVPGIAYELQLEIANLTAAATFLLEPGSAGDMEDTHAVVEVWPLPIVKPEAATYLAFWFTGGGDVRAAYYRDGEYVGEAAATSGETTLFQGWAQLATGRYLLLQPGNDASAVISWDTETGSIASYAASAGYVVGGPWYFSGFAWWLELGDVSQVGGVLTATVRLRKATATLGTPTTVTTLVLTSDDMGATAGGGDSFALAGLTQLAAVGAVIVNDQDGFYRNRITFRIPLDGSAAAFTKFNPGGGGDVRPVTLQGVGLPATDGLSKLFGESSEGGSAIPPAMFEMDDSATYGHANAWPATAMWPSGGSASSISLLASRATIALYKGGVVYEAPIVAPYPAKPTKTFRPQPNGSVPNFMFPLG